MAALSSCHSRCVDLGCGHLMLARMRAGLGGQQGSFQEGHKLDLRTTMKIPKKMIGRTLSHQEAFRLLKQL
jgi:hypothetical protein